MIVIVIVTIMMLVVVKAVLTSKRGPRRAHVPHCARVLCGRLRLGGRKTRRLIMIMIIKIIKKISIIVIKLIKLIDREDA